MIIPHQALAEDTGLESLKRQTLPWYDAAKEQVKPIELTPRDEPHSELRGTIPEKKPASKNNGLRDFFDGIFGDWSGDWGSTLSNLLYWLLWIAVGVGLVILVIWVVRNVDIRQPMLSEDAEPVRSRAQSVAQLPFQIDTKDDDFRSLARKAVETGDHRRAIICLFSHVLVSLDQHDLIRLKKGKTNRQYLRELSANRELSNYYADVMLPFEATFFGDKDPEPSQLDRCWNGLPKFEDRLKAVASGAVS